MRIVTAVLVLFVVALALAALPFGGWR